MDLDGTLLDSCKQLTEGNRSALMRAAEAGIEIVPTTGRIYDGMPECIRELPYLRYAVTINGAQVRDIRKDRVMYRAEIPWERAVEIMSYLDGFPLIYDCCMDNWGWMSRRMWEQADVYAPNAYYVKMIRELRTPVEELKQYVTNRARGIQKIQFFTNDMSLRSKLMAGLEDTFADISVSSSVEKNVEINHSSANKGAAMLVLARCLGIDPAETAAFGDGLNDLSMIRVAGMGIAMANAHADVLACADAVVSDCDSDGVAEGIVRYCL